MNFGEDLFFFGDHQFLGGKKPLNFGFRPKDLLLAKTFFFFFFFFGGHLILGEKKLNFWVRIVFFYFL